MRQISTRNLNQLKQKLTTIIQRTVFNNEQNHPRVVRYKWHRNDNVIRFIGEIKRHDLSTKHEKHI